VGSKSSIINALQQSEAYGNINLLGKTREAIHFEIESKKTEKHLPTIGILSGRFTGYMVLPKFLNQPALGIMMKLANKRKNNNNILYTDRCTF